MLLLDLHHPMIVTGHASRLRHPHQSLEVLRQARLTGALALVFHLGWDGEESLRLSVQDDLYLSSRSVSVVRLLLPYETAATRGVVLHRRFVMLLLIATMVLLLLSAMDEDHRLKTIATMADVWLKEILATRFDPTSAK